MTSKLDVNGIKTAPAKARARRVADGDDARRSQASRRDQTRSRILDATLHCLATHGYAGTGVAQVVAQAGVSRGAWSHHFPSMSALILEAAQTLIDQVYLRLANLLRDLSQSGGDAQVLIRKVWDDFYASEINQIYLELLVASRRDAKLAEKLSTLTHTLENNLNAAATHFFEANPGAGGSVTELMHLNRWVLRGIALDAPLLPPEKVDQALDAWSRVMATQISKRGAAS